MNNISRRALLRGGIAAALASSLPPAIFADIPDYAAAVPGTPVPVKSKFGYHSTAEEVTAGVDLSGKTALITGCNSGLGLETMRVLALRGAHVIGTARTREKAEQACASVEGTATPLVVELTDLPGIVNAANQVDVPVDMLILNAGIMALQERRVANAVEMQFAVNHLGHFLLTHHLLDRLIAAEAGRVVVVSSGGHRSAPEGGIQFDNLDAATGYTPFGAYGQSKLANNLFSRELARRLSATSATSNAVSPGVIKTNLGRHIPPQQLEELEASIGALKTVQQGAGTQCYVSTSPDLDGVTGYYFSDCNPASGSEDLDNDDLAARLWTVSEELLADHL